MVYSKKKKKRGEFSFRNQKSSVSPHNKFVKYKMSRLKIICCLCILYTI